MTKKSLITLFTAVSILLSAMESSAGTFTAFGPKTFTRGSGKPIIETASFNIKNPSTTYTLMIYNGGTNSEYSKISSAIIKLNGSVILDTSDFNQQVSQLQKQVAVTSSNTLSVELRSVPGSALTVLLEGEDDTPPAVIINSPVNGTYLNNPSITVSGTVSDAISWVNTVSVNGTTAALTGETYNSSIQLTEGPNTITATATDAAENTGNASVSVVLDTTPPKITLDAVKTITNNPQLIFTGKIEDASPVSLTVNGIPVSISNNTFSAAVTLTEGNNTITVSATDKAGNSAISSTNVTLDTFPPVVSITSHQNGQYLNTPQIAISGTVSEPVTVTVNGISAGAIHESPVQFSSNLTLAEGQNTITVIATDEAGNNGNANLTVTLDTILPTITLSPMPSITNSPQIQARGNVEDANPIDSVMINGKSVGAIEELPFQFNTELTLSEGLNTIKFIATDKAGNSSETETTILLDTTPPIVSITSPVNQGTLNASSLTVTGISKDASSGIASVTVNGINAEISGDAYSTTIQLKEGENQVTVTATDAAGNTGQSTITIYLDTTAPAISINSPEDGSAVNTETVTVTGTVDDNAATVIVNGISATVSDNTFNALAIALLEGTNQITATATDQVGNKSTAAVAITRLTKDITPPVVKMLSPSEGYTSEYQEIEVLGVIDDDSATVTVNGAIAKVFKRGTENYFTASGIKLMEGRNIIIVMAVDGAGNTGTAIVLVTYTANNSGMTIQYPFDGSVVNYPLLGVWGTAYNITNVMVNGIPAMVFSNSFSATLTLIEGPNTITVSAYDMAGSMVTKSITVTYQYMDTTAPAISITYPLNGSTLAKNIISVTGTVDDNTATVTVNGVNAMVSNNTFNASNISLKDGSNIITVTAKDIYGNTSTVTITVFYALSLPPDPATVAPPLDNTVATSLVNASAFLYTGNNPIQTGVLPETIEAKRVAVLRGQITASDGTSLSGVKITILNHPEYGSTLSRGDGMFDMAVNGGGWLTVSYEKNGYLPVQRKVDAPWQDYAWLDDVVMIPYDSKVTSIDLNAIVPIQVAQGSEITDADGTRKATLLFQQGTYATMHLSDGSWLSLSNINVRATEYTLGENGPKRMPGLLPPTSGYTYAVELSLDEAVTMGAKYISFSKPVITYIENFLNFPVGGIVPVGWYDRENEVWVPSDNGKIIKILSITNGSADIDINGSNTPASSSALLALGITDAERQTLATLYQPGQSLWRVPITHFTPWDCNWPFGPPDDATPPRLPEPEVNKPDNDPCTVPGSIIECQNQTLGESIDVLGTPFTLNYRSGRVQGRKVAYALKVPVSEAVLPASIEHIDLEIYIAGRKFTETFSPLPNQTYTFIWDGKDAFGRALQGLQPITVRVGYVYQAVYQEPANFAQSFGAVSGVPITTNRARQEITLWQERNTNIDIGLGIWDARGQGMGAWTLNVHHSYDTSGQVLSLGTGGRRSARDIKVIDTIAGGGDVWPGDGGLATSVNLAPSDVVTDSLGNLFISENSEYLKHYRIRKISTAGIITTVASSGDGSVLRNPNGIAVDDKGNIFIADTGYHRVRKVSPNGNITTVAGQGYLGPGGRYGSWGIWGWGYSGDSGLAADALLYDPIGLAVDSQGNLFIADSSNHRIRKISPDGTITTVAGSGPCGFIYDGYTFYCPGEYSGDGGPATNARLNRPTDVEIDNQGNLFIADRGNNRIRKVSPNGIITTVAGNGLTVDGWGTGTYSGDGGPAINAGLNRPTRVALDNQGNLFITDAGNNRIRKVSSDGYITTVAGGGDCCNIEDRGLAIGSWLSPGGIAVDEPGNLFIAANGRIRKVYPAMPEFSGNDFVIPSEDGTELYDFDAYGKHMTTIDAIKGGTLYTFTYDANGYLTAITAKDGNVMTIERDSSGNPTAIIAPGGQRTELTLDANGYLSSVTNPAGESHQMTYTAEGLLTTFTKPKGSTSILTYDGLGRLIKDEDAVGGFKTLSKTGNKSNYTSTVTTAEGHVNSYQMESLSTGASRKTNTDPSGLKIITDIGTDGISTTTAPDGTISTTTEGPDPRFGMQAPITSSMTVKTPSGLTYTYGESRTISLSDSNNPLSIVTLADTKTINGKTFTSLYDAAQKKITATTPVGRQRFSLLDNKGRVYQEQTVGLEAAGYQYDAKGRLTGITQGTRTTTIVYDSLNQISSITDAANRTVSFTYDLAGRVTQQTLPDSRVIAYSYDANGNVTSITPPGRPAYNFTFDLRDLETYYNPPDIGIGTVGTQYTYNLDKQLTLVTRPDGQTISMSYDNGGRINTAGLPGSQLTYTYNAATGKRATIATSSGETLAYTYDGSLLTSEVWSGIVNGNVSFAYNNDFRVISESINGGNTINFAYDNDGQLVQAGSLTISRNAQNGFLSGSTLGNVTDSYAYNTSGELTNYTAKASGNPIYEVQYSRDSLGRISARTETTNGVTNTYSYSYDTAGRLTDVSKNGSAVSHYEYDTNGNRISANGGIVGVYDAQDRLLQYGGATYGYTANGELQSKTEDGQTTTYNYDVIGNLLSTILSDGNTVSYVVDGRNRRVGKKLNGALVQGFIYSDQLRPVVELDNVGNVVSRFVYGVKTNVPDYMTKGGATYRIISDHLGSPRVIINTSTGQIAQQLDYDEFGKVIQDTNPELQPFRFAGGLYDKDTKLTRFGARDYDASVGRFVSKDPLKFGGGDTNLYGYVKNQPQDMTDPYGLAYGTTNCSYYQSRCAASGDWYYCYAAPTVCNNFPDIPTNWDSCTRQCLQEYDAHVTQTLNPQGCGGYDYTWDDFATSHAYCFSECTNRSFTGWQ